MFESMRVYNVYHESDCNCGCACDNFITSMIDSINIVAVVACV